MSTKARHPDGRPWFRDKPPAVVDRRLRLNRTVEVWCGDLDAFAWVYLLDDARRLRERDHELRARCGWRFRPVPFFAKIRQLGFADSTRLAVGLGQLLREPYRVISLHPDEDFELVEPLADASTFNNYDGAKPFTLDTLRETVQKLEAARGPREHVVVVTDSNETLRRALEQAGHTVVEVDRGTAEYDGLPVRVEPRLPAGTIQALRLPAWARDGYSASGSFEVKGGRGLFDALRALPMPEPPRVEVKWPDFSLFGVMTGTERLVDGFHRLAVTLDDATEAVCRFWQIFPRQRKGLRNPVRAAKQRWKRAERRVVKLADVHLSNDPRRTPIENLFASSSVGVREFESVCRRAIQAHRRYEHLKKKYEERGA